MYLLLSEQERVAHELGTVSNEHLYKLGTRELEVGGVCLRNNNGSQW